MNNLSFDDVLMVPKFSFVRSRADVQPGVSLAGTTLNLPIISSNMDTVTGSAMAKAMHTSGGVGCLHRFWDIEKNVQAYKESGCNPWVSIGLGQKELERAEALFNAGATTLVIDVAHGASMAVVEQTGALRDMVGNNAAIVVGNFASGDSLLDFQDHLIDVKIDAFKIGIGGGSACLTRVITGCGAPSFGSMYDCFRHTSIPLICDGGCRTSGDVAKALAAGATAVMLGKMLAGTDESPGEVFWKLNSGRMVTKDEVWPTINHPIMGTIFMPGYETGLPMFKKYRGSASTESYKVQGKEASHRSYEGDSFMVPYVGSVTGVLDQINGGLRSTMSYLNSNTIKEMQENVEFIEITSNGVKENYAHGK